MSAEQPTAHDPLHTIARPQPTSVPTSSTLRQLAQVMERDACSAVVVSSRSGAKAVVTERDIVRALAQGSNPDDDWAVDVMSAELRTLDAAEPIRSAAALMHDAVIRHVIVRDDSDELSLVSIRDLLAPFLASVEP